LVFIGLVCAYKRDREVKVTQITRDGKVPGSFQNKKLEKPDEFRREEDITSCLEGRTQKRQNRQRQQK
ncbi:MAG: hypothetical protein LIP11_09330, partial [Clostridiales bacterium]|nr:hypothetical protein [Clostridiales bacterium]